MENENKRATVDTGSADSSTSDSTNRARNRTIMLTPEMTGQVRARLVAPGGDEVSPLLSSGEDDGSEQMQPVFRPGSWQPSPPPSQQVAAVSEDDNDWTRPISTGEESSPTVSLPIGGGIPSANPMNARNGAGHLAHPVATPNYQPPTMSSASAQGSQDDVSEYVVWKNLTPITGFLVSFDNDEMGAYVELRQGRLIVTSEEESTGNYLCIRDRTVSPMHAIMRVQSGGILQVLDQLSESGTRIIRAGTGEEELLSGEKGVIRNGDIVCFGERKYHVCLLSAA